MIPFDLSGRREWLETNGLGGYASSTIAGLNTRRYHGLLVAATRPPAGRMVLLSKIDETLIVRDRRTELSVNQYPGVLHPQGHLYLVEFRRDPFPVFVYEVDGVRLEKSVFMVHGTNRTVVEYRCPAAPDHCALELRPLVAFRDYHATTHQNPALDPSLSITPGCVRMAPYPGVPPLYFFHSGGEVGASGYWYRNFQYERERERGLDWQEDLFQPFVLSFDLTRNPQPAVVASVEPQAVDVGSARAAEIERRKRLHTDTPGVAAAADQFIVARGGQHSVIAGYHWFGDWGRDTMISLPGLTLATGRHDIARSILSAFANCVDRGMLPNRFPDAGEVPEYNTVDATLWFFEAARAYAAHTSDYEFLRARLYGLLDNIIAWHERGTRYGIHVDGDGLLVAGAPGVQLTWMDAKVGDWVVTPRSGKPVEIQALWYNALRVMEEFAGRFGQPAARDRFAALAGRAQASFRPLFWNEPAGCLYDVVDGDARDASIRPNQLLAVSLPHGMLPPDDARRVVETVRQHLLTPYGLRTLAPGDPHYRGRYEGDPWSRDSAYHQGTVWPWLLGPFLSAYLAVNGRSPGSRRQAALWMAELLRYRKEEGMGQIPEVFDGDAPHRAGGCIAQAWSIAEMLRIALQDLAEELGETALR